MQKDLFKKTVSIYIINAFNVKKSAVGVVTW